MSDTKIILNVVQLSIPDDHPAIYQYISGGRRSRETAIANIVKLFDGILTPPYSIGHVRRVVKSFLKVKQIQYKEGKIKIKPIY